MYDEICKFIAENFAKDLSTWLLGKPLEFTLIEPTELQIAPIRADRTKQFSSNNGYSSRTSFRYNGD